MKMSISGASTDVGSVSMIIQGPTGYELSYTCYPLPLCLKERAKRSLPNLDHEHQCLVNDYWLGILGNMRCDRLQTVVNVLSAVFIDKREIETLHALF
jgi:hypothetical protein